MKKRLNYHFEPKKGWINDPNGLIYFKGKYHMFFQHNPFAPKWDVMHWGHAVSDDLIHWQELPIALYPDMTYENDMGCFSGSAIIKNDRLYLFYTCVSKEYHQAQALAYSDDGITFTKYENNPIIKHPPIDGSIDFRDPKVMELNGKYYMVIASGKDNIGKVLLYTSTDLFNWDYSGVLLQDETAPRSAECPDFFKINDKFVLIYSKMTRGAKCTQFVYGDFDGKTFIPIEKSNPAFGVDFYAPQTFEDNNGRRILIGWMRNWDKPKQQDQVLDYAGAMTIPLEVTVENNKVKLFPVKEAYHLLKKQDELVEVTDNSVKILAENSNYPLEYNGKVHSVDILKDEHCIEVFVNSGESYFTYCIE